MKTPVDTDAVLFALLESLNGEILPLVIDCNSASEAYKTLADLYARTNTVKLSKYLKELNSFAIDESKAIAENLVQLESIERGLIVANGQESIKIKDLMCLSLANSLPDRYSHLRYNIYETLAVPNHDGNLKKFRTLLVNGCVGD
jgi:hypothetical protein